MGLLKRVGGFLGFLLVLAPCIIAGIYAGNLNTSRTLAQWAVGVGAFAIEMSIFALLIGIKEGKYLRWGIMGLLVGAVPAGIWIGQPLMAVRPFEAHLQEYFAIASSSEDPPLAEKKDQPLRGKMIPLNMKTKKVDPVLRDLSKELRAERPEQVGTVAALWWRERRIGHYGSSGGAAYQWDCRIVVWDKASGAPLRISEDFIGSEPPSTSKNGVTQSGDKPYKQITAYLNGLSHQ